MTDKEMFFIAIKHDIMIFGEKMVWEIIEKFRNAKRRLFLRNIYLEVLKELKEKNERIM